jgi:hypothetical protein
MHIIFFVKPENKQQLKEKGVDERTIPKRDLKEIGCEFDS